MVVGTLLTSKLVPHASRIQIQIFEGKRRANESDRHCDSGVAIAKISWMSLDKVTKINNFKGAGERWFAEASGRAIAKRAT